MIREILFWGDYFENFYNQQDLKVRKKIDYVLWLISYTEKVPIIFLKYLEDTEGLYEIKISSTFKEVHILCFFDDNKVIILINCFLKKSQRTPKNEIELGAKLKNEYFTFKNRSKKK
jgi:phage-related protein